MYLKRSLTALAAVLTLALPLGAQAQSSLYEDFTSQSTVNGWYFFNGACLTAGSASGIEPANGANGRIPGCTRIAGSYYNEALVGGANGTFPDPNNQGALRFTNGRPGGYHQNGGILSVVPFSTTQGISITFKTVTYLGDSGGAGGDGADGISFFLMDASQLNTATITGTAAGDGNGLGSWGGSLGYSCSNSNPPYNGLIGGYVAIGIDEYGNFLNGQSLMSGYTGSNSATGDNSALGYGYRPNRIGMRGAGNIAWNWLNANYPVYYPSSYVGTPLQQSSVQNTCRNGVVWDSTLGGPANINGSTVPLADYAPITNAYSELPSSIQIANESAQTRGQATAILYRLKITAANLLSLSYSINGGSFQPVISGQSILASNGAMPANLLFGFAGSTGGSTNIHEILCFRADPATTANTSAGASEKQSAKLQTGVQAFFAFYNPANWSGRVTGNFLGLDANNNVVVSQTPNWDAACVLNGGNCPTTGVSGLTAQSPTSRVILSWNGTSGIPFEWGSLTSGTGSQQAALTAGDNVNAPCSVSPSIAYAAQDRLSFLRGDRSCELNAQGQGLYRARAQVLADIIDSSPQWVGPPVSPYPAAWSDRLYPTQSPAPPENSSGVQTYPAYVTAAQTRLNVVYTGSNDGLLHGFRAGSFDTNGNFVCTTGANGCTNAGALNDGQEVLAYMPGAVVQSIHSSTANLDYSNSQYGHNFFVDATPGTGDLFYGTLWHSWLVGGLGPGGKAIYALDVTNPAPASFTEANAAKLVVGEWTNASITCTNVASCGNNLGNTYGTPQIRRLHDGQWAVIFGNGLGSASGDAGIYLGLVSNSVNANGLPSLTFYYLSTHVGTASNPTNPNAITYTTPVDLDGDHISDYVYAGDIQGNLWRFDLTCFTPGNETTCAQGTPFRLFNAGGQPITTQIVAASGAPNPGMQQQLMLLFGTGRKTPLSNTSPATYVNGTQSLYGVWDWNLTGWNGLSHAPYYSAMASASTGLSSPYKLAPANLQQQTVTVDSSTQNRDIASNATVCWAGQSGCTGSSAKFGWYFNLPGTQEQIIYNPEVVAQALTVNSIVPAVYSATACSNPNDTGFTYVVSAMTGGAFKQAFLPPSESGTSLGTNPRYTDAAAIGVQTNATGSSFIALNSVGTHFLVYETDQTQGAGANIANGSLGLNLPPNTIGRRLGWIERR